jgi:hypothetical protein
MKGSLIAFGVIMLLLTTRLTRNRMLVKVYRIPAYLTAKHTVTVITMTRENTSGHTKTECTIRQSTQPHYITYVILYKGNVKRRGHNKPKKCIKKVG